MTNKATCCTPNCKNKSCNHGFCERHYYESIGQLDVYRLRYTIENNKPERILYRKKYRQNNLAECRKYDKEYAIKNHKELKQYKDNWYKENSERLKKKSNARYYSKKESIMPKHVEWQRQRRRNNPYIRMVTALRSRMKIAIKSGKGIKMKKTMEYLGGTPDKIRNYLESKFKPGMSWNNYGLKGWHVDHILPCSSFDLTREEERMRCFHYTNLQPLWAKENMEKGNKIIRENIIVEEHKMVGEIY